MGIDECRNNVPITKLVELVEIQPKILLVKLGPDERRKQQVI